MKKVLVVIGLCLLVGYLIFAFFYFPEKPKNGLCSKMEVVVESEGEIQFVDATDIQKYISAKGLNPQGKKIGDINTGAIEKAILSNQLIKKAEVFTTNTGNVKVVVHQRKPILRIMSAEGENYYIDTEGGRMPLSKRSSAYLPIATGSIKENFAKGDLYQFALFLSDDAFWNAQIEQIVVAANKEITLIPRVGNQQIILGQLAGYAEKLQKLMTFYKKGLNESGWNRYSIINLKYDKQVVCTKRPINEPPVDELINN